MWCSKTCGHPKEDLAKSGYGPGMKVFFLKSFYILATLLEPVVEIWQFNFFLLKSDELWPLFFIQKSLAYVEIIFSS